MAKRVERLPAEPQAAEKRPTVRLHLWLETDKGMLFGLGRAHLLAKIQEHGSLRKAAEDLSMSYRAAWGKIKKSEEVLGKELIFRSASKRDGYQLTDFGKQLLDQYTRWYSEIEIEALRRAEELFPWSVKTFDE